MSQTEDKLLQMITEGPVTPDEAAKRLGVSWATANSRLLRLVSVGSAEQMRKGRVNIFLKKPAAVPELNIPRWVRSRNLAELAQELEPFFKEALSSGEIVGRERRKY